MSLKAVHIIFITASTLLAFGFGVWSLCNYSSPESSRADLYCGVGSVLGGIGLIAYGRYFLRKLKNVEYL